MKKYVQISGYGDQWFWLIESIDDIDDDTTDELQEKMEAVVKSDLYTDGSKTNLKLDWLARVSAVQANPVDYSSMFLKYGPIVVREIGSFMLYDSNSVVNTIMADKFPSKNSSADIVVCENDYHPEMPWIVYLNRLFPDQCINVLNLFRTRKNLSVELNVKYITFYTTFTNYDWFERILDTILENGWTGKKIIGHCVDRDRWTFPIGIYEKVTSVIELGNTLEMVDFI